MPNSKHPGRVRSAYEFIKAHRDRVQMICRILEVAVSGLLRFRVRTAVIQALAANARFARSFSPDIEVAAQAEADIELKQGMRALLDSLRLP